MLRKSELEQAHAKELEKLRIEKIEREAAELDREKERERREKERMAELERQLQKERD